jgi:nucleoside-diphosphate-sugar epimerase
MKSAGERTAVLITGSTGLIGTRLSSLLRGDHLVIGIDRDPPRDAGDAPDEWIECDLTDDASVHTAVEQAARRCDGGIARVVHLAAHYDFSGEPSPLYEELTVEGTRRLLRALRPYDVEQLVFASSLLVMRPSEDGRPLDEESPVEAEWAYPQSKLQAERVIREERGDVPAVVLRIAGVYDEECRSIPIAQQMRRILERKLESFVYPGNPEHGQPFVHLDDLTRCIRATIERRASLDDFELFLIGEPDVVSYGDLQDLLGEAIHGREWPTIRIPAPLAKAGAWIKEKTPGIDPFIKPWMVDLADADMPIATDRALQRLGWTPSRRLRSALPELARRLLDHPRAWYETNGIEPPDDLEEIVARARPATSSGRER